MQTLKLLPLLVILCLQLSANAQDKKPKNHEVVEQLKLASTYLEANQNKAADSLIRSAISKGADMNMLIANSPIKRFLKSNPKEMTHYSTLRKSYLTTALMNDQSRWIDTFQQKF